ncbi:alpha-2,8-polysialyltransferase family protein [Allopusillimonas ginsengisoli]|uniref:alpha-2,8-polysialyltransferase family protein n=1 Tax=Allopusillimonas ginsengisoli TaxID=453575 RepID=UPI00101F5A30|nr:alpha-2,8-polysialyltransferase family protein [Allopusillimonas ginsengisoli]TEA78015.1 hypothetical protein ERE07_11415 [Allopusillimonas ginsengisoli]
MDRFVRWAQRAAVQFGTLTRRAATAWNKHGGLRGTADTPADNLFVVSHVGQLRQVQALIRFEKLAGNYLAVLYTSANLNMPVLIEQQVNKELFSAVSRVRIPRTPNRIALKKLSVMKRIYKTLLRTVAPRSVFLLSFERHYAVLATLAKQRGCTMCLVEEGTATYKLDARGHNLSAVDDTAPVWAAWRRGVMRCVPGYRSLLPALSYFRDFDRVYAAFPELLNGVFNYRIATRFFLHAGGLTIDDRTRQLVNHYDIGGNDILFVSQRYPVNDETFCDVLVNMLALASSRLNARVFIKMHHKDRRTLYQAFRRRIDGVTNGSQPFVIFQETDFPVEPLICLARPKAILGIASTALVYTQLVSPETRAYAIGPWFLNVLPRDEANSTDASARALISEHLQILEKFPGVTQAQDVLDIDQDGAGSTRGFRHAAREQAADACVSIEAEHTVSDSLDHVRALRVQGDFARAEHALSVLRPSFAEEQAWMLEQARLALAQSQWEKSLCYFSWAYPTWQAMSPGDKLDYVRVLLQLSRFDEASEVCATVASAALRDNAGAMAFVSAAVETVEGLRQRGSFAQALACHDAARAVVSPLHERLCQPLQLAVARVYIDDLQWMQARETLARLDCWHPVPDTTITSLLLRCYEGLSDADAAWRLFRRWTHGIRADEGLYALFRAWALAASARWDEVLAAGTLAVATIGEKERREHAAALLMAKACRQAPQQQDGQAWLATAEEDGTGMRLVCVERARLAMACGQWQDALQHIKRAYRDHEAWLASAQNSIPLCVCIDYLRIVTELGKLDDAQAMATRILQRSIVQDMADGVAMNLAATLVSLIEKFCAMDIDSARVLYDSASVVLGRARPDSMKRFQKVELQFLLAQQSYDTVCDLLLERFPLAPSDQTLYGILLYGLAERGKGERCQALMADMAPEGAARNAMLVWVYCAHQQWDDVIAIAQACASELDRAELGSLLPELAISKAYRMCHDFEKSNAWLNKLPRHGRTAWLVRSEGAQLAFAQKDWKELIRLLTEGYPSFAAWARAGEITEISPIVSMPACLGRLYAHALAMRSCYTASARVCDTLIAADDKDLDAIDLRVRCAFALRDWSSAVHLLEAHAMSLEDGLRRLTYVYRMLGDMRRAVSVFGKPGVRGPENPAEYELMAEVYQLSGRFREAARCWHTLLIRYPDSTPAYAMDRWQANLLLADRKIQL